MRVVLMGNPNVGKSAIFNRLTGVKVIVSNYPGTTVEYTEGVMRAGRLRLRIVDAPGTYSLIPSDRAERVALDLLIKEETDLIINVVDATNLERNLYLTLQLMELGIPMILDLNMVDVARHKGIDIDTCALEETLGIPVVSTVAVSGEGIDRLHEKIREVLERKETGVKLAGFEPELEKTISCILDRTDLHRWQVILGLEGLEDFKRKIPEKILSECVRAIEENHQEPIQTLILKGRFGQSGAIVKKVQRVYHRHPTLLEKLGDITVKPFPGIFLAGGILLGIFYVFVTLAGWITDSLMTPFFEGPYDRVVRFAVERVFPSGFFHDLLLGAPGTGYLESLGLLTTGVFVPVGIVLPAVFIFYLILTFLEDIGYLPRLAVLVDSLFHRLGLHGYSVIPVILALGCNVPGAIASRILETKRQRFILLTLLGISVPCTAQTAVILSIIGPFGIGWVLLVYGILLGIFIGAGSLLNRFLRGETPEIAVEIPPYRPPRFSNLLMKTGLRIERFLLDAVPWVFIGISFVNVLYLLRAVRFVAEISSPILGRWLGVPPEAIYPLVIGFLRKDVATGIVAPLLAKGVINLRQAVIVVVMLAVYFPCAAAFAIFLKELGL
ncbi:ferrous iron transport protein B, partial [Candidatus Aerophobetes bacterium]|nr:ferrous iron transport protein B [Candidatus Aerophobetes bacterium]